MITRHQLAGLLCGVAVGVGLAMPAGAQTWSGEGADENWSTGGNWVGGAAPANPATTLTFGTGGLTKTGTVDTAWTTANLVFSNTSGEHVIDLGGNTLRINTRLNSNAANSDMRLRNGRLELRGDLDLSVTHNSASTLTIDSNVTLDSTARVRLATRDSAGFATRLDLRGVTVAPVEAEGNRRVLTMNGLQIGALAHNNPGRTAYIWLDDTTTIDELRFTGDILVGIWNNVAARVGVDQGSDTWKLPDGLDLTFGTTTPRILHVGVSGKDGNPTSGQFNAGTGGVLRANLSRLDVGSVTRVYDSNPGNATGRLLLGDMAGIEAFACTTLMVGNSTFSARTATGYLSLPPGNATVQDATIGSPHQGIGQFSLNDTTLRVNGNLLIEKTGRLMLDVGPTSSGLVMPDYASFDVKTDGEISATFTSAVPVLGSSPYHAVKLGGDHVATLEAYEADGRLVLDTTALGDVATLVDIFAHDGSTFVGIPPRDIAVTASNTVTGSTLLTDSAEIGVTVAATPFLGEAITDYAVSESAPDDLGDLDWQASPDHVYTIQGGEGTVTLYGWARDAQGRVIRAATSIVYATAAPTITIRTDDCLAGSFRLVVAFDTSVDAVGHVEYRVKDSGAPYQSSAYSLGTSHTLTITGLEESTPYELVLHANATTLAHEMTTATPNATDNVTWTGGTDSDMRWSEGLNWAGLRPPANPTTGTITLPNAAQHLTGLVTAPTQTIRRLTWANTTSEHKLDLDGKTLMIDTRLYSGAAGSNLRFLNGTLQVRGDLDLSVTHGSASTLTIDSNVTLDSTARVRLATNAGGGFATRLDLRGVTVAPVEAEAGKRVLTMNGLQIGALAHNNPGRTAYIWLDDTTMIDELRFTGDILVGIWNNVAARVGVDQGSDVWRLPDGLDLTFGTTVARILRVGVTGKDNNSSSGQFNAGTGGMLRANLSSLDVGCVTTIYDSSPGHATGRLLLGGMTGIESFTCSGLMRIGFTYRTTHGGNGQVSLPPGDASTHSLLVGSPVGFPGEGHLTLEGTRLAVASNAKVDNTGTLTVNVEGQPAGLDLAAAAELLSQDAGRIEINFLTNPDPGLTDVYWGLRWEGDKRAQLIGLLSSSNLVAMVSEGVDGSAGPLFIEPGDPGGGYTYITVQEDWGYEIFARDLTREVLPPEFKTLVTHIDEIDINIPPHPDLVSRRMESAGDTTSGNPDIVTLANVAVGETNLIALIHVIDEDGSDVEYEATSVLTAIAPNPTTDNVEWVGTASTALMERREWGWSGNWFNGRPPTNPYPATVWLTDFGKGVTGIVQAAAALIGGAEPYALNAADSLSVTANGEAAQVFSFQAGTYTAAEVADVINATASGFVAAAEDDALVLRSLRLIASSLEVANAGTEDTAAKLGLAADERTPGRFTVANLRGGNTSGLHTIDLGGNALRVGTRLFSASTGAHVAFTNGLIELPGKLDLNVQNTTFTFDAGTVVDYNAETELQFNNDGQSGSATLDLSRATIAANAAGRRVMRFRGLKIGNLGHSANRQAYIMIGPETAVDELFFDGDVLYGIWNNIFPRIGTDQGGNVWRLPDGLDLTFGTPETSRLVRLAIPQKDGNPATAQFRAGTGGGLTAYLSALDVAYTALWDGTASPGTATAYFLFGDMDGIDAFVCSGLIRVGVTTQTQSNRGAYGYFSLPPGDASTHSLLVGSPADHYSVGSVTLNGTRLAVSNDVTIDATGTVLVRIGELSCGLDLDAAATFDIAEGGTLTLDYSGDADGGRTGRWGLRWQGMDAGRFAMLSTMRADERITATGDVPAHKIEVYTFGGDTYVGLPPPRGTLMLFR